MMIVSNVALKLLFLQEKRSTNFEELDHRFQSDIRRAKNTFGGKQETNLWRDERKRYNFKQPLKSSVSINSKHFCSFSLSNTCSLLKNAKTSSFFLVSNDRRWLGLLGPSALSSQHTKEQQFCLPEHANKYLREEHKREHWTDSPGTFFAAFQARSGQ